MARVQTKGVAERALRKCLKCGVFLLVGDVPAGSVRQLLPTTDVTATPIAPAAPPTPTAASGATTRSASQPTVTAAW